MHASVTTSQSVKIRVSRRQIIRLKAELEDLETKLKALASAGGDSDDLVASVRAQVQGIGWCGMLG